MFAHDIGLQGWNPRSPSGIEPDMESMKRELERLALAAPNVMRILDGATPKKVIVVPDRLVNLVI